MRHREVAMPPGGAYVWVSKNSRGDHRCGVFTMGGRAETGRASHVLGEAFPCQV